MATGGKGRRPGRERPRAAQGQKPRPKPARRDPVPPKVPPTVPVGPLRLGVFAGASVGKWVDIWQSRVPDAPITLVPLEVAGQREAIVTGAVDVALVRLPIDRADLQAIPLYQERTVAVMTRDSSLTAADELVAADLAGEVVITPADDVLRLGPLPGTVAPRFAAPVTTEDAIATAATGVGIVLVPMSLARLHHRKDLTYRPVRDLEGSAVALAWHIDRQTPAVDAFIGIVRGRTANSSR